ncbi:MAG: hypothetical protein ABFS02_09935 [Pseudomonadota bacterium]
MKSLAARCLSNTMGGSRHSPKAIHHLVFKAVQRDLLRKGVLLMTQARVFFGNPTKTEHWRFTIPPVLAARLPCPFDQTERFTAGRNGYYGGPM